MPCAVCKLIWNYVVLNGIYTLTLRAWYVYTQALYSSRNYSMLLGKDRAQNWTIGVASSPHICAGFTTKCVVMRELGRPATVTLGHRARVITPIEDLWPIWNMWKEKEKIAVYVRTTYMYVVFHVKKKNNIMTRWYPYWSLEKSRWPRGNLVNEVV